MPAARPTPQQRIFRWIPWALALAASGTAVWLATHRSVPVPAPVERMILTFGREGTASEATGSPIAFSPDGSRIVYVGRDSGGTRRLYLRALDRVDPAPISGTEGADQPFFSPDGLWLGFRQNDKLKKVALAGGAVVTVTDLPGSFLGASWGTPDLILFSGNGGLFSVQGAGGAPVLVVKADSGSGTTYRFPDFLPDGRAAVFTTVSDSGATLRVVTLDDGGVTPLGVRGMSGHFVETGHLVYLESDGTLFAVPFDPARRRTTGAPVPIADNVRFGPAQVAKMGVARTGAIAHYTGGSTLSELVFADRSGRISPLGTPSDRYGSPRFSHDGRRIAVTRATADGQGAFASGDLWVWDLGARNFQRITFDSAGAFAEWSPDDRRLIYIRQPTAAAGAFYGIPTDGSGTADSLFAPGSPAFEIALSPDGRRLLYRENHPQTGRDIWSLPVDSPQAARPLLATPFDERNPAISPDGQWLAYASNETGDREVYVRGLAEGSGRTRISLRGGAEPRWAPNGRELYFRSIDSAFAVAVSQGSGPRFGPPVALFAVRTVTSGQTTWDVSPDGETFIIVRDPVRTNVGEPMHLILHWFGHLQPGGGAGAR